MSAAREASRNPLLGADALRAHRAGEDSDEAIVGAILEAAAIGSQIAWADDE